MNTSDKLSSEESTKKPRGTLWRRLNIKLPWLKLILVPLLVFVIIMELIGLTISQLREPDSFIKTAPMSHHVRVTERSLEGKKLVALTFDDGPFPETTPRLLDILTEKDLPATFFTLGTMARAYPEIIQRIKKEHHEVASHTMYHQNLIRLTREVAQADLDESRALIREIIGEDPAYVRPPYGNFNDFIAAAAARPLIIWSVDSEDWRHKDTDAIVATVMSEIHDGAIILMHDIYPTSVEAVPTLVDTVRAAGYEFATVSELAKARGVSLTPGTAYYNFRP